MANGQSIRPAALAAGAATVLGMYILYRRETTKCTEFASIWKEAGPIHLNQKIQDEAFELAGQKLRSVAAAGQSMTVYELRTYLVEHFAPACEWAPPDSPRGKQVLESFGDIARYSKEQFNGAGVSDG